jgi:hypothetical protein
MIVNIQTESINVEPTILEVLARLVNLTDRPQPDQDQDTN